MRKYPVVEGTRLYLSAEQSVPLDSAEWDAWLSTAFLFYVVHPAGNFAVARETRGQRGAYWIARRTDQGRRGVVYLGKRLRASDIDQVGHALAERIAQSTPVSARARIRRFPTLPPRIAQLREELPADTLYQAIETALARESNPDNRRALQQVRELLDVLYSIHPPKTSD